MLQEVNMDDSDRLSALRAELVKRLGRERYDMWVGSHTTFDMSQGALRIGCASGFELQLLRRKAHESLLVCCRHIYGSSVSVEYFVCPQEQPVVPSKMVQRMLVGSEPSCHVTRLCAEPALAVCETPGVKSVAVEPTAPARGGLSRSSFANFVVGPGNELACQTAKMVAERVGRYGPLLLHGPAGVGKSHLLYAMMRELRRHGSSLRSLRLTAEQFTTEFLDALNRRTLAGFRQKYRTVDVLLIDDIQFIASKRATLDELLVTIDALHERGKQVVLTCDKNPQELLKLSSELATRISGGLAVPMELPDFATRQALVRRIVGDMHPTIGMAIDDEVVVVIATQVAGSARQLCGAINRLIVTSEALRKPLTADLTRSILADYMQQITPTVRLPDIQKAVCEVFGVEPTSLKSASKSRSVAEPRMLAMSLACNLTRSALGEISEFFGRRSHSTVISAQRKIEKMISQGEKVTLANQNCTMEEAIRKVQAALRRA
jgi:chromosomal replication initiator protein